MSKSRTERPEVELFNKHANNLGLQDASSFSNESNLFTDTTAQLESAVVFLPKSKALIDLTLALVSGRVVAGGTIVLAGEKKGGIESAKKAYEANIGPVDQKIVGNHSALYVGKNQRLGAAKKVEDYVTFFPVAYKGPAGSATFEAAHLPGVFSAGELDEGTKLLLDAISYDAKTVLDIGCGSGVIGAVYKKMLPESDVTMSDKSVLATKAAAETFRKNGLTGRVFLSDVFDGISGSFDAILCNPPFHSGIGTDYSFIERFARSARAHLNRDGSVYVVANAFLSYKDVLEKHIGPTETIAENSKFRVYRSTTRASRP